MRLIIAIAAILTAGLFIGDITLLGCILGSFTLGWIVGDGGQWARKHGRVKLWLGEK